VSIKPAAAQKLNIRKLMARLIKTARCNRDRDGKLKLKAKYQRKYGLPEGAAPDSLTP
jgi:hypothetical protein